VVTPTGRDAIALGPPTQHTAPADTTSGSPLTGHGERGDRSSTHPPPLTAGGTPARPAMAMSAPPPSAWLEWAAEYTKAAQAEARPPPEWAARVAAAAAAGESGDVPCSAGLAEVLARALLSGGGGGSGGAAPAAAAAWKYAEAALAARLASPALLLALLSTRYGPVRSGPVLRFVAAAPCVVSLVCSVAGGGSGIGMANARVISA